MAHCWALGCINEPCDGISHRRLTGNEWAERADGQSPLPVADEDWLIQHAVNFLQNQWRNHHSEQPTADHMQRYALWFLQLWRDTPEGQRAMLSHTMSYHRWCKHAYPFVE